MKKRNEIAEALEEAGILKELNSDITSSWKTVLRWKNITQAELSRRTGITECSISLIIAGQRMGTVDNIVLMCLAMNVPLEISLHLLRISGHVLVLNNERNVIYNYLLKYRYKEPLSEIKTFLEDSGSDFYMKIPL